MGQDPSYLRAAQAFLGGGKRPRVSAPDWYQFFASYRVVILDDSPAALKRLWGRQQVDLVLLKGVEERAFPVGLGRHSARLTTEQAIRSQLFGEESIATRTQYAPVDWLQETMENKAMRTREYLVAPSSLC